MNSNSIASKDPPGSEAEKSTDSLEAGTEGRKGEEKRYTMKGLHEI
jgi:hypothetical protein